MGTNISNLALPCNLMVPDLGRASAFYADLFGWSFRPPASLSSNEVIAELRGETVASLIQSSPDFTHPAAWSVCFPTTVLETALDRIATAFGEVVLPPSDFPTGEHMALAQDPTGAVFGICDRRAQLDAGHGEGPGGVAWRELNTRDANNAATFYAEVFGLCSSIETTGAQAMYRTLHEPGQSRAIAGIREIDETFDRRVTGHWLPYFRVSQLPRAIKRIRELGGALEHEPFAMELGRAVRCADNQGSRFCLLEVPRTGPAGFVGDRARTPTI